MNLFQRRRPAQVAPAAVREEREAAAERHERLRRGADEGHRHRRSQEGRLRLEPREPSAA